MDPGIQRQVCFTAGRNIVRGVRFLLSFSFLSETGKIDQEIHKYNTPGFTGCLSRVQFNQIAPLKAALRQTNISAHVHIQGELVESNCGASPLTLSPMSSATDPWHLDHLDSGKVESSVGQTASFLWSSVSSSVKWGS